MVQNFTKGRVRITAFLLALIVIIGSVLWDTGDAKAASSYPYLIKVNRKMSTVTIYEKDKKGNYTVPVKAMACSPGWDTKLGTFRTPAKYRWRLLMGDVWGQYSTRIVGGILFHSAWYYEKDPSTLSNKEYNKLGTICSHGCIRLNVRDAKWIYDNCPIGTTVVIYDSNDPGPLGKPATIKVSTSSKMGWDPTDIWSKGNPYNKKNPVISGAKNKTIQNGSDKVDVLSGVKAKASTGDDCTSLLTATIQYGGKNVNKVDVNKAGKYSVTYKVTDQVGKTAAKTVTFTVKVDKTKPKLTGVEDIITNNPDVDRAQALKNVKATWKNKTLSKKAIDVTIKKTKDEGVYKIIYTATASNGMKATDYAYIYVDDVAPVITGVEDKEIAWDTAVDKDFALEDVDVFDEFTYLSKDDIEVTIKEEKNKNRYVISYRAEDEAGNIGEAKAVYTITDFLRVEGASDKTVPSGVNIDSNYALAQGVKAYDGEEDITSQLEAWVNKIEDRVYEITYHVEDGKGNTREIIVTYTQEE